MDYNALYNEKIYENGTCPHLSECNTKQLTDGHTCYRAKIGKEYETAKTKILFVGKEAPEGGESISSPIRVRDARHDNRHYFGLYYTALLILTDIIPKDTKQDTLKEYEGLEEQYCLTNYFKCAFKKKDERNIIHGVKTNSKMKRYCPALLVKEIDHLRPDIVVIQGKFTGEYFWGQEKGELNKVIKDGQCIYPTDSNDSGITLCRYNYLDNQKPMYILWGFHPASSDFYKRGETNNLERLKEAIQVFKSDWNRA